MSQERRPEEEDWREFMSRLEREFPPRGELPPDESPAPYREPVAQQSYAPPQRVRLTLPMSKPWAVYVLLVANIVMYGLSLLLTSRIALPYEGVRGVVIADPFTAAIYLLGAKENISINAGQWWRLLIPMVLHGSLMHLLFNSWALYALGTQAEEVFGTARFLAMYLLAGLAGSIASYVFNPQALSVGASGAIFGLFGALAAFSYTSRSLIGWEASKMQLGQMSTLVVINLAFGFIPGSNIDNSAHIGGLVVGGLVGFALAPRYTIERRTGMPSVERRDPPLAGWIVAAIVLAGLVGLFLLAVSLA